MDKTFTIEDALKIQHDQMMWWKKVLKRHFWLKLEAHVVELNKNLPKDPYCLFRGTEIDNWVMNNCK